MPKKVKGSAHLYERHGCYFARRQVPEQLRPVVGRNELWERLDPNLSTAKRRLPAAPGLVERVAQLRSSRATHLFPQWYQQGQDAKQKADRAAKSSGKPTSVDHFYPRLIPRRFNVTCRKRVGITDKRKDFHAFRHSFKTGRALAGVTKDVRDALAGHSDNSAGSVYVQDISIEGLKAAIDKLHFDGLEAELNLRGEIPAMP